MNTPTSAETHYILWGDSTLHKRVNTFLRGQGGAFSHINIQLLASPLPQHTTDAYIYLIDTQDTLTPEQKTFLTQTCSKPNVAAILLTDNQNIRQEARDLGHLFFCGQEGTALASLSDTLALVHHTITLKAEQHYLQQKNQEAHQRFQDVADQFADWLFEIDTHFNLTFSSNRTRPSRDITSGTAFAAAFLPEEKLRIEDDFADLSRHPRPFHDRDYWSTDAHGSRICWSVSGVPVHNTNGDLTGFRGVARDISAQKANTDQLYFFANHDALTGLYNRARFFDALARNLRKARREKRPNALVMFNLDQFMAVNETYGHSIGDKLLIHVSQILKDNLRTGDFLARTAGDEFAIIMSDVEATEVTARLERIILGFKSRPLMTEKGAITIRFSTAIVHYPNHTDDPDTLLLQGDKTLRLAKAKGRNRVETYSPNQEDAAHNPHKLAWADLITRRLQEEEGALILHYQPIVTFKNKEDQPSFYEVLVRMKDDENTPVPPHKFIGTAEDFGLIRLIDQQVSLRTIERLKEEHASGRKLKLSVNLSGKTFDDEEVCHTLINAVKAAKMPDKSLIIEITETDVLRDLAQVKNFMSQLKKVGVGFALDDCGGGFSSFNTIRHLDLDFLKIDGSFVRNMHTNPESKAFVEAIQHIAEQKNIPTIAEMVENKDVAEALTSLGIQYGQGFYFAPPTPEL